MHFDYSDYAIEQSVILTNSDFFGVFFLIFLFKLDKIWSKQLKKLIGQDNFRVGRDKSNNG